MKPFLNKLFSSPRTTTFGILTLLSALGLIAKCLTDTFDGDPKTVANWDIALQDLTLALAALGLIGARDNNKSSEDVGAK